MVLGVIICPIAMAQLRGRVRHGWFKQIFDHLALLAPINALMYLLSSVSTRPFVTVDNFAGLREFDAHCPVICNEACALIEMRRINASDNADDAGGAGSMRYHLGLDTPNDERCAIWVDGKAFSWRDGVGVLFDEPYMHWVRNDTDRSRLILLCDIERPLRFRWAAALNRAFSRHVMSAAAAPNDAGDPTGLIGRLFRISAFLGLHRRRYKLWSPALYQVTRGALVAGLIALIVWW